MKKLNIALLALAAVVISGYITPWFLEHYILSIWWLIGAYVSSVVYRVDVNVNIKDKCPNYVYVLLGLTLSPLISFMFLIRKWDTKEMVEYSDACRKQLKEDFTGDFSGYKLQWPIVKVTPAKKAKK